MTLLVWAETAVSLGGYSVFAGRLLIAFHRNTSASRLLAQGHTGIPPHM